VQKLMILFTAILTLTGISNCQTPGLEEPDVTICTIITDKLIACENIIDPSKSFDIDIIDGIGLQCVSPNDYASLKTHHEAIHRELNKKRNPK